MSKDKSVVKFVENTGVVDPKAFSKGLPENLTDETFAQVDAYREYFVAKVANAVLDEAERQKIGDDAGEGLSVTDIKLGGNTTASVAIDNEAKLLITNTTRHTEITEAVLSRASDLYTAANITEGTEEDVA